MLKVTGIILILTASVLFGYLMQSELYDHVNQLVGMKEMLIMLSGEISYAKTPLEEAFLHIANQGKEPYAALLKDVRERMNAGEQIPLQEIWRDELSKHKEDFLLKDEEYMILENAGDNFGYLDWQMQIKNINVYVAQVEARIVQAQDELATKQKMYQYLSVMGGLFLIIILI